LPRRLGDGELGHIDGADAATDKRPRRYTRSSGWPNGLRQHAD